MPLTKDTKTELIDGYKRHESDTGSPEVQIALLSKRISQLTEHLRANKHDVLAAVYFNWSANAEDCWLIYAERTSTAIMPLLNG